MKPGKTDASEVKPRASKVKYERKIEANKTYLNKRKNEKECILFGWVLRVFIERRSEGWGTFYIVRTIYLLFRWTTVLYPIKKHNLLTFKCKWKSNFYSYGN